MSRILPLAAFAALLATACTEPSVQDLPIDGLWELSRTVDNPDDVRCSPMIIGPLTLEISSADAEPVRLLNSGAKLEGVKVTDTLAVFTTKEDVWRSGILQGISHDLELDGDQLLGSMTLHADSADHSCEWTVETVGVRGEIPCLRSAGSDCAF